MEKIQAIALSNLLDICPSSVYEIDKLETTNNTLRNFHQWSNGKPIIGGYNVTQLGENNLYFLFIDWHRNENYYLVIYSHNKSTTYAEIQQIVEHEGRPHFLWKYNPLKRDGKNAQRKAYFKQIFDSTSIHIPVPTSISEVDVFIKRLFKLCSNRVKADRIPEIFPIEDY